MNRIRVALIALSVGALVGATTAGSTNRTSASHAWSRGGVVVQVPTGWTLTAGRINNVTDPATMFTASTFSIPKVADVASGHCSVALQRAWRADGAYVQLTEERDGASRATMLKRVRHRPAHFVLSAKGAGGLCTPANSGSLSFQTKGRAFYVFYGFGPKASKATRARATAILDSMKIAARA